MPVNIDIKGNLSKLLATENLIVEHRKVQTASFDLQSRVLTLPMWDTSNFVYDMLVAHEVSHALHTPMEEWKQATIDAREPNGTPVPYLNIVEDARIERLIKNKYAGLSRDFYKGYEELNAIDFFEIADKDINNFKLIDKINLYFKIGAYLCLEFNDTENQFITEISQAETFAQVVDISRRIYEYTKEQQKQKQQTEVPAPQSAPQSGNDIESGQGNGNDDKGQSQVKASPESTKSDDTDDADSKSDDTHNNDVDADDWDDESGSVDAGKSGGDWTNIDQSDTQSAFDENITGLNDESAMEKTYINIPALNLDNIVIPFDTIHNALTEHFNAERKHAEEPNAYYNSQYATLKDTEQNFFAYKKSASKDVNHLVKEFEMKKSADSYARQAIAKTGVLDTSKLHSYLYNEDIFRKVTTIPEGKNHGLIFLLDWSGSMSSILDNTLKQLFNLVWFCNKVNIPYEVYAFTNDSWILNHNSDSEYYTASSKISASDNVKSLNMNDLTIEGTFRLVNILSSKQRAKTNDAMMLNLWLQARGMRYALYNYCRKFALSGTPLNEAIVTTGELSKLFIKQNKIQKCHVIVLTDGEGQHSSYNDICRYDNSKMGSSYIHSHRVAIRNGGKTFIPEGYNDADFTTKLVEAVKSDLPNVSFIGIRILERGGLRYFYERYGRKSFDMYEDVQALSKKQGAVFFKGKAFDLMCGINQTTLHASDELEVEQGAEKRAISNAFKKMNKSKKSNKFMVKEFIKVIA